MKVLRYSLKRPTHPGAIIREDILPELDLTQGDLAKHLGVSRVTVSEIIHEKEQLRQRWLYEYLMS